MSTPPGDAKDFLVSSELGDVAQPLKVVYMIEQTKKFRENYWQFNYPRVSNYPDTTTLFS